MLDEGVYSFVSEISDSENISKSYISRILRLALLAPDIVEAILAGRMDQGLMLERLEQSLPANWQGQRLHALGAHTPLQKLEALASRLHASPETVAAKQGLQRRAALSEARRGDSGEQEIENGRQRARLANRPRPDSAMGQVDRLCLFDVTPGPAHQAGEVRATIVAGRGGQA